MDNLAVNVKIGVINNIFAQIGAKMISGRVNAVVPFRVKLATKQPIECDFKTRAFQIFSGVKLVGQISPDSLYYRKTEIDTKLNQKLEGDYDTFLKAFILTKN